MSIIEDQQNLSPAGKIICLILFLLGVVNIAIATSQIGKAAAVLEIVRKQTAMVQMLPSNPEEAASRFSLIEPQDQEEREKRIAEVKRQLELIFKELPSNTGRNPKEVLMAAIKEGVIHPSQAKELKDEMELVRTPKP